MPRGGDRRTLFLNDFPTLESSPVLRVDAVRNTIKWDATGQVRSNPPNQYQGIIQGKMWLSLRRADPHAPRHTFVA